MEMNHVEKAIGNFTWMNCHQSVLSVFGPRFGLSEELCLSLGLSYGGGMGRQGKTCGAVTAAYTLIGLWASRQTNDIQEQKKLAAEKVKEFNALFQQKFQDLECRDLLGCNLSIPEQDKRAREEHLYETICPNLVGGSTAILASILS